MDNSLRTYRFAYWGIIALAILHFIYYVYIFFQIYANMPETTYYGFYMSVMIKRFLIVVIILGLEILVYWSIRRRLFKRLWVRIHIILLWCALLFIPIITGFLFLFIGTDAFGPGGAQNVYEIINKVTEGLFWGSLAIGHLFFILTIIKSFSKKDLEQTDGTDSPHVLDEFNQQIGSDG